MSVGSYNLSKMGTERFVTFVAETLEFKFGVRIWCLQECQKLKTGTQVPGYLLYKKYDTSSTAVLVPQVWARFITGTHFQRCCASLILGTSFAIVSCYLADSSKCLETFEGTLKSLDTCLHLLKHKFRVETIVVGADAQCQLPMNKHGVGPRCFALPFRNSGRGRSRSLHELCVRFGLTAPTLS